MVKISQNLINKKLLAIIITVTFIFLSLSIRLFYIQIINKDFYVTKAFSQWTRDLPFVANRGLIKDCNGIVLAKSSTTYTLYARPVEIENAEKIASIISPILDVDSKKLIEKLNKKGVSENVIMKNISQDKMKQLICLDIKGLYLTANAKRIYPNGNFLTQTLGFVSSDNIGQSGLELVYNKYLLGENGFSYTQTDLVGRKLKDSKTTYLNASNGFTLNLTIDSNMQAIVEKAVFDAYNLYSPKSVSCILMDTSTGKILSIAAAPTFDLNDIPRDNLDELNLGSKLSLVCDVYEPGSTFKIITSAIGIENNKIKNSYYCPGFKIVDGQRIKCWRSIGHNSQDFKEGIANSCNCVFMDVALSCGVDKMYQGYENFGLFNKTGVDFPGEINSIKIKKENVKNVDLARIGFGQAIAVTGLQLINAVSSIINGGNLYKPYLVDSIYDEKLNKYVLKNEPTILNKTVSNKTSSLMREYLFNVVENGGGKNAKIDGYLIGGKTGTSQKYENGMIARGKYVSSFLGFTNVENKDIACLFLVDEPKGYAYYGSIVAAPFVKNIFQGIFDYKQIEKTTSNEKIYNKMPNLKGLSLAKALSTLEYEKIDFEYQGEDGYVYYQIPEAGFDVSNDQIVYFCVG